MSKRITAHLTVEEIQRVLIDHVKKEFPGHDPLGVTFKTDIIDDRSVNPIRHFSGADVLLAKKGS